MWVIKGIKQIFCILPHQLPVVKTSNSPSRRRFLQAITGITFGLGITAHASAQEYEPSVTFNDQTSSGEEVTVAEIVTNKPVYWRVHADGMDYAEGHFDDTQQLEDEIIKLEKEINISRHLYFSIYPKGGGHSLAHDDALVKVENDSILGINEIEKDPDAGFHFPYFLYVPPTDGQWNSDKPLIVQQNNSPSTSDDYSYHKKFARKKMDVNSHSREISDELGAPLLVPITPRPHENYEANRLQSMDNKALRLTDEQLERIDLQILSMIDHAQKKLESNSHPVQDKVILNGYSGSGQFAQRFAMLHPERVLSVSAGGLSGVPTLPLEEANGHTLNYYIGIADIEEITGKPANLEAVEKIDHYYYEGGQDKNDFIPTDEPLHDEIKETALKVFGEDMVEDRVPFARQAFEEAGIPIEYRIYEEKGHEWAPVEDLITVHDQHVPENEPALTTTVEKTTPTTENDMEVTTTRKQQTSVTESTRNTTTADSPTTSSESPGLSLLSGLTSVIGATYVGSRLLGFSDK